MFGEMIRLTIVSREVASDAMAAPAITFSGNLLSNGSLLPSSTMSFPQEKLEGRHQQLYALAILQSGSRHRQSLSYLEA